MVVLVSRVAMRLGLGRPLLDWVTLRVPQGQSTVTPRSISAGCSSYPDACSRRQVFRILGYPTHFRCILQDAKAIGSYSAPRVEDNRRSPGRRCAGRAPSGQ